MIQHVLLGDLAPLAILGGLTGPILRPLLRFVHPLRRIFHPFAALGLWALNLYVWHLPFLYEAALRHDAVHALEHICFFTRRDPDVDARARDAADAGVVRHRREARLRRRRPRRRDGARQHLHLAELRLLLVLRDTRRGRSGCRAIDDQRLAGSVMMVEGSLVTIVALAWLFLRLAAEGELRQRLLERGLDPRAVRRAVRYGRAQELEQAR